MKSTEFLKESFSAEPVSAMTNKELADFKNTFLLI